MQVSEYQHGLRRFGVEAHTRVTHAISAIHDQLVDVQAALFVAPQGADGGGYAVVKQLHNFN